MKLSSHFGTSQQTFGTIRSAATSSYRCNTYNENGTYLELLYAADEDSECLDNPSIEVNGTWQKINATTYSFTTSNNETSELIIEFNSNDTFQITFSTFSNPNDPAIQTIIETYNRIE